MEKGLLSTIQSWYVEEDLIEKSNGKEHARSRNSGRYIQLILLELSKREPEIFEKMIRQQFNGLPKGSFSIQKEYYFQSKSLDKVKGKYADLAIFIKNTSNPIILVEIKYNDCFLKDKSSEDFDQLPSYIKECNDKSCKLLILTKNNLDSKDAKIVRDADPSGLMIKHSLLGDFGDFGNLLKISKDLTIAHMFYDYLKDEGLIMQNINIDLLYRFFHRLVNPWDGSGKIQSSSLAQDGATNFQLLLNNMLIVGNSISGILHAANRRPSIDFSITPTIKTTGKKIKEAVDGGTDYEIRHDDRVGGSIWVFAHSTLYSNINNGNSLIIRYGYNFTVKPNLDKHIDSYLYATISSKAIEKNIDSEFYFEHSEIKQNNFEKQISDKSSTEYGFLKLIKNISNKLIESGEVKDQNHLDALNDLKERLSH